MRHDGYAAIEDYALIGDGRTAALVARDGAIDWLCLPNFDSPSVNAAILDVKRGGAFTVQPAIPFSSTRRYLPNTNVLETTFHTDAGTVRLIDALTLPDDRVCPLRELTRLVLGDSGEVPMMWRMTPRFQYGRRDAVCGFRGSVPVAASGADALAVLGWDTGTAHWSGDTAGSDFHVRAEGRALLALVCAYGEPLTFPARPDVERRLDATIDFWGRWTRDRRYEGPWSDAVLRSALVLKALIYAPSGASVAAPTTSIPEWIGGERNWDYRFCWVRDSNFAIDALVNLGCYDEAESLFWWFMQATALTEPSLRVLYRLDGGIGPDEQVLPLEGYRGSRPARIGNAAASQQQLDVFGCLLETAHRYSEGQRALDPDIGEMLARIADHVCDIWRTPDSGIWEVRNGPFHFIHSKVMCWVALDRALRLADRKELPVAHVDRWRREMNAIHTYVNTDGWSERLSSYRRVAGEDAVDASLLMLPIVRFGDPSGPRIQGTLDAIMRRLRQGDFVWRYRADDGVAGDEGAFLNCSFWLASALARAGRNAEASALMERLVLRSNDVGLYSEEVDIQTGGFLGNFPQALVHLALIDAAVAIRDAEHRR